MTDSATRFVTPMTFEVLSGQRVGTSLWGDGGEEPLDHVEWAREADLVVVAPATANFLAKMAHGLADDLPSTLVTTASGKTIVVAPAMNDRMWSNPANQQNLETLRSRGIEQVDPGSGFLACGVEAEGRLAEPEVIARFVLDRLSPGALAQRRVLVTGGGTREAIDAVRFIGNRSSGRMGIALAASARDLGAEVTLLLGPTELSAPTGVHVERFESSRELAALIESHRADADFIAMSAAVGDYRPVQPSPAKHKKQSGLPSLKLEATDDILLSLGAHKPDTQCLIGFALETGGDDVVEREAAEKLSRKHLDLVCGNRADRAGEGFSGATNRIYLLGRDGEGAWLAPSDKATLARQIWLRAASLRPAQQVEEGA